MIMKEEFISCKGYEIPKDLWNILSEVIKHDNKNRTNETVWKSFESILARITQPQPTSKEVDEALTIMGRIRLITLEGNDNVKIRYTIAEKKEIQNAFVIIEQALQPTTLDNYVDEAISRVQSTINLGLTGFRISPPVLNKQFNELKKALKNIDHTAKEVYIIMSPEGGIGLDISSSKGKCFTDLVKAEKELKSKNDWSKAKGYGTYELVTLEVK